MANGTPLERQNGFPKRLLLKHNLSPGDTLVASACIASLHITYPNQYITDFSGTWGSYIYANNTCITKMIPATCAIIELHYNAIHETSKRQISMMSAFCEHLSNQLGRPIPLQVTKPQLYLTEEEKNNRIPGTENIGQYLVLNSGTKSDFTTKGAGRWIWQQVVSALKDRVTFVQVGEQNPSHRHPPIEGAINMVGKTSPRQLFQLVHHSLGGLSAVSLLMHVCSALDRPCVVTGGGREEPSWCVTNQTIYLHTMGLLPCCAPQACWKSHVLPSLGKGKLCELPVVQPDGECIPRCHQLLGSRSIINAIETVLQANGL